LTPAAIVWPGCGSSLPRPSSFTPSSFVLRPSSFVPRPSSLVLRHSYPSVSCEIRYCSSFL
jgi:hypothetical protein